VGIRAQQAGDDYGIIDDVVLSGLASLRFHNLQVDANTSATFQQNVAVQNNLIVNGVMDIGGQALSVESTVTNNGILRQTQNVSGVTRFLHIQNAAQNASKYYGVDITPAGAMGSTTVSVKGNEANCSAHSTSLVSRCYSITPTTSQNTTLKLWYTNAERNGQEANTLVLYTLDSALTAIGDGLTYSESGTTCTSESGMGCWAQANNVNDFTESFGLSSGTAPPVLDNFIYLPLVIR
jgi:hypothetical protein